MAEVVTDPEALEVWEAGYLAAVEALLAEAERQADAGNGMLATAYTGSAYFLDSKRKIHAYGVTLDVEDG